MKRKIVTFVVGALAIASLFSASCSKADSGDCRKAVMRIRELTGTSNIQGGDIESAVRSCRGNATRESVRCAIEAGTVDELERCGLLSKEEIEAIKEDKRMDEQRQQALRKRQQQAAAADAAVAPDAATVTDAGVADSGSGTATGTGAATGTGTATGTGAGTATATATGTGAGTGTSK